MFAVNFQFLFFERGVDSNDSFFLEGRYATITSKPHLKEGINEQKPHLYTEIAVNLPNCCEGRDRTCDAEVILLSLIQSYLQPVW